MSLKLELGKIINQYNKGIITSDEAANKAYETVSSTILIDDSVILNEANKATDLTKQKELLVTRLIQIGNEEQSTYDSLFKLIIGRYCI